LLIVSKEKMTPAIRSRKVVFRLWKSDSRNSYSTLKRENSIFHAAVSAQTRWWGWFTHLCFGTGTGYTRHWFLQRRTVAPWWILIIETGERNPIETRLGGSKRTEETACQFFFFWDFYILPSPISFWRCDVRFFCFSSTTFSPWPTIL
jgi:hypothetical protein